MKVEKVFVCIIILNARKWDRQYVCPVIPTLLVLTLTLLLQSSCDLSKIISNNDIRQRAPPIEIKSQTLNTKETTYSVSLNHTMRRGGASCKHGKAPVLNTSE